MAKSAGSETVFVPGYADRLSCYTPADEAEAELIAVGCSRLTGFVWDGHVCTIDTDVKKPKAEEVVDEEDEVHVKVEVHDTLATHAGVTCTAWVAQPEGPCVLFGGDDGMVHLWNRKTPAQTQAQVTDQPAKPYTLSLVDHADAVTCVGVQSNGRTAFSGSLDRAVKVWDLHRPAFPVADFRHAHQVWDACWQSGPKSPLLLSVSRDRSAVVRDVRQNGDAPVRQEWACPLYSCAWASGGGGGGAGLFAIGGESGEVTVFDMRQMGQPLSPGDCSHTGIVRALAFSPDGSQVCSVADDRTVRLLSLLPQDNPTGEASGPSKLVHTHADYARGVCWSARRACFVSASWDHTVQFHLEEEA